MALVPVAASDSEEVEDAPLQLALISNKKNNTVAIIVARESAREAIEEYLGAKIEDAQWEMRFDPQRTFDGDLTFTVYPEIDDDGDAVFNSAHSMLCAVYKVRLNTSHETSSRCMRFRGSEAAARSVLSAARAIVCHAEQ